MYEIEFNFTKDLKKTITKPLKELFLDLKQPLTDVGVLFMRRIDLNFALQFSSVAWEQSQAAKDRSGLTLVDTGTLRASFSSMSSQYHIYKLSDLSIKVGSSLFYAQFYGKDSKPLRDTVFIDDETINNAKKIISDYIIKKYSN